VFGAFGQDSRCKKQHLYSSFSNCM
jgi:hypothetical protein